jgi:hypothetical protein
MRSSPRFRRTFALAATGGLAAAGAWLPAGPAAAAAPIAVYIVQGSSSAESPCSVTSGSSFATKQKNLQNGRSKGGVNLVTTWADTGTPNPADVTSVTGHYSGSTHLVKRRGAFRSASLTGSGSLSITKALGSSSVCGVSAQLLNAVEFTSTQPNGWFYVTRSTTKSSLTETVVARGTSLDKPVFFELYQGGKNKVTQRAFVRHGPYVTALVAGIEGGDFGILLTKNGGTVQRGSNTNTMSAVFRNAGSALTGARGSATKYVKFPASVSCSKHKATLTWKSGSSKVAAGSLFVNGSKKAAVSTPKAGQRTVLKHLSAKSDNKVSVKLTLKSGGHATAARMYVPCKG